MRAAARKVLTLPMRTWRAGLAADHAVQLAETHAFISWAPAGRGGPRTSPSAPASQALSGAYLSRYSARNCASVAACASLSYDPRFKLRPLSYLDAACNKLAALARGVAGARSGEADMHQPGTPGPCFGTLMSTPACLSALSGQV